MAYLQPYTPPKCSVTYCGKRATCRLVDTWNGERGYFCAKHGKAACDRQAANEAASFRK